MPALLYTKFPYYLALSLSVDLKHILQTILIPIAVLYILLSGTTSYLHYLSFPEFS